MTFKKLRYQIYLVLIFLIVLGSIGIVIGSYYKIESKPWQIYKTVIPLIIALPTAWLAFSFQRRNSYLKALREFWSRLLPTIQKSIAYTFIDKPTKEEYSSLIQNFSIIIDDVRSVFKNIGEGKPRFKEGMLHKNNGLYPYESLKYILKILTDLNPEKSPNEEVKSKSRKIITKVWKDTHFAILQEFDRNKPSIPISPYHPISNYKTLEELKNEKNN
ncbi:MAG: hypothetical protein AAFO99_02535 [Bacteroidota bacterium]